jgi:hypothetical protein
MRNCLFSGKASRFLKGEANSSIFLKATGKSLNKKTMRDRELINRFCAFQLLGPTDYKGDMDDFLARALELMNDISEFDLETLSNNFTASMKNNYLVFGKHAFRKHQSPSDSRSVINASLWDVMSTGLSVYSDNQVEAHKKELQAATYDLFKDTFFNEAISLGTNQVIRVQKRFRLANNMLQEVLGDSENRT